MGGFKGSGLFGVNRDEKKKVLLHSTTGCFFSGFVSKSIISDASADRSYMVNGTGLRYI